MRARPGREAGRFASPRLLGLYIGSGRPGTPARIILYEENLRLSAPRGLAAKVRLVLKHELGHHLGLDDARLRKLGH